MVVTCCKRLAIVFCGWEGEEGGLGTPAFAASVLEAFGVFGSARGNMIPRLFCLIYVHHQCSNGHVA